MIDLIKNKIKSKSGITAIWMCMFFAFMIALLIFIIEGGKGYLNKTELQQIADSVSLGGARYGVRVHRNPYEGAKINIFLEEGKTISKANELFRANTQNFDNKNLKNVKINYNFEGKISSDLRNTLFRAGILHVEITAEVPRIFGKGTTKVAASSTTKLNPEGVDMNKSDVRIVNEKTIQVFDSNGSKIFEKTVE